MRRFHDPRAMEGHNCGQGLAESLKLQLHLLKLGLEW
jgi:hypothetical protein